MNFSRPSTGAILGGLALFVALGGTAVAAATVVNIADPTTPSRVAHVDAAGRLEVGDGNGPLAVDGYVGQAIPRTSATNISRRPQSTRSSAPTRRRWG